MSERQDAGREFPEVFRETYWRLRREAEQRAGIPAYVDLSATPGVCPEGEAAQTGLPSGAV